MVEINTSKQYYLVLLKQCNTVKVSTTDMTQTASDYKLLNLPLLLIMFLLYLGYDEAYIKTGVKNTAQIIVSNCSLY